MSKIRLWAQLGALAVIISLFSTACYEYHDDTYLDELDVTITYYDTNYNFQQKTTYAIRDSVGIISDYLSDTEIANFYKPGGGNDEIKALVKSNMDAMGYSEVSENSNYDLGVNLVVAAVENTEYYYSWWYGYYGYYGWYWGGWYPYYGYPWYPVSYTYQKGMLLMELVDGESLRDYREWADDKTQGEIENADPDEVPDVNFVWQSIVSGVAGSEISYNKERAARGINEAFEQSPYLIK
jgi:Domain of unknown function (DUF4136)